MSTGPDEVPAASLLERAKRLLLGAPRDVKDPKVFHAVSLIAILAWVGLGADGLSSSSYGPEEAFKALGEHTYLAVGLAFGTALTVFVISLSYSKIIEHFPFGGLGVHCLLTVQRLFPNYYKNFIFVSIGVIDSATFKNIEEVEEVRARTQDNLIQYVELCQRLGLAADFRMRVGTEAVAEAEQLCREVGKEFPRSMFFAGKLIFAEESWTQRILHNETGYQLQRRLQFAGLNAMVLPVRVLEETKRPPHLMGGRGDAGSAGEGCTSRRSDRLEVHWISPESTSVAPLGLAGFQPFKIRRKAATSFRSGSRTRKRSI